MRARWNNWLKPDNPENPFTGNGGRMRKDDLACMAVHALGVGSSVAYERYIKEDSFPPGPLYMYFDDGIYWVEYRGGGSAPR